MNIVGLGPSHDLVPWREEETWGLPWDAWSPRYDLLFEMHDRSLFESKGKQYMDRLRDSDVPVIMQERHDDIPNSVAYPLDAVSSIVGDYYGSSVAYMVALAITRKENRIVLYGVDLSDDYDHQRPNLEYLIGFARGRGIEVEVPEGSLLLKRRKTDEYQDMGVIYPERYGSLS